MKAKIWIVIIGISLLGVPVVYGAEHEVEKQCEEIITTDFQGEICISSFLHGDRVEKRVEKKETRIGRWVNVDGGIFEGEAEIQILPTLTPTTLTPAEIDKPTKAHRLRRKGKLTTPIFQGTLSYYETNRADQPNLIVKVEIHEGRWQISPQLKLEGKITLLQLGNGKTILKDTRRQVYN